MRIKLSPGAEDSERAAARRSGGRDAVEKPRCQQRSHRGELGLDFLRSQVEGRETERGGREGRRKKTQQQRDPLPMPSGYLAVQDLPQPGKEGGEAGRGGWRGGGQAEGGRRSPAPGGPRSPAGTPQPWGWAWLPHPLLVIIIVINY